MLALDDIRRLVSAAGKQALHFVHLERQLHYESAQMKLQSLLFGDTPCTAML